MATIIYFCAFFGITAAAFTCLMVNNFLARLNEYDFL